MSILINEKKMVDDTRFAYEDKFHSPMSRFIDKTQTYVTYFHIADEVSTTDEGFNHVDDFLGKSSPVRYKRIENFPLYGLEQILLSIDDTESGLDRNYEGEAVLINSTIVPRQNDMFMIPNVQDFMIFRITAIGSDNIMTDNYHKVTFMLEYIDREKATWLNRQTIEKYTCILENIGTERKCIIRTDLNDKIRELEKMYDDIRDTFVSIFYVERYNAFLGELDGPCSQIYDPFLVEFINRHDLFNKKNQLDVIIPAQQFEDSKRKLKYERSIYRFFERRDLSCLTPFKFTTFIGLNNQETAFARYSDKRIQILDVPISKFAPCDAMQIFSDEFVEQMKKNQKADTRYGQLLIDYIQNDEMTVDDIPLDLIEELLSLNADAEIYFIIPIIMYIIRELIAKALGKKKDLTSVEV